MSELSIDVFKPDSSVAFTNVRLDEACVVARGSNGVELFLNLTVVEEQDAADVLAKIAVGSVFTFDFNLHASIFTSAFWFPMNIPVSYSSRQSVGSVSEGSGETSSVTSLVSLSMSPSNPTSSQSTESLFVTSLWRYVTYGRTNIYFEFPDIRLHCDYHGPDDDSLIFLSELRVHPFLYQPSAELEVDFSFRDDLPTSQLTAIQTVLGKLVDNAAVNVSVQGAGRAESSSTSECLLQRLLDIGPPIPYQIPETPPYCSLDEMSQLGTGILSLNELECTQLLQGSEGIYLLPEEDQLFLPAEYQLTGLFRGDSGASRRLTVDGILSGQLDLPFDFLGDFPALSLDVSLLDPLGHEQNVSILNVEAFSVQGSTTVSLNLIVIMENESLVFDCARRLNPDSSVIIRVRAQSNNFFSQLLSSVRLEIPLSGISNDDDDTVATNIHVYIRMNQDDAQLNITARTSWNMLKAFPLLIRIPSMSLELTGSEGNASELAELGRLDIASVELNASDWYIWEELLLLQMTEQQASTARSLMDVFQLNSSINLHINGVSTSSSGSAASGSTMVNLSFPDLLYENLRLSFNVTSEKDSSLKLLTAHVLDSTQEQEPIVVPCLFAGTFCSDDPALLAASNLSVLLNLSVPHFPFSMDVEVPALRAVIYELEETSLLSLEVSPSLLSSNVSHHNLVPVGLTFPSDLAFVQAAVRDVMERRRNMTVKMKISGLGISSQVFSFDTLLYEVTTPSPGAAAETPPILALDYTLTDTSDISASFDISLEIDNPMDFAIGLSDVTLKGLYTDIPFVSWTMNEDFSTIHPGQNMISGRAVVFGEDELSDRCRDSGLLNLQFCVPNEFLSALLEANVKRSGSDITSEAGGVPVQCLVSFTNVFGDAIELMVDLVLWSSGAADSTEEEAAGPDFEILAGYVFEWWEVITLENVLAFINGNSAMTLPITFQFHNPFAFGIDILLVELDVLMKDLDGSPDLWFVPGGAYGRDEEVMVLEQFSYISSINMPGLAYVDVQVEAVIDTERRQELSNRLYDELYVKEQLCLHLQNFVIHLQIQSPNSEQDPLIFSQAVDVYNLEVLGDRPCDY